MSCCGKEWKQKIKDKCTKHPNQKYQFFCTNDTCLQILCKECIQQHKEAHINFRYQQPEIFPLAEVEAYFNTKSKQQIKQSGNNNKDKEIDPCRILCQVVDDYFYGSDQNRTNNEKARSQKMKDPTATKLIDIVEKEGVYRTTNNFKDKYFQFLDSLFKDSEI